jgi:trigger factor
VVEHLLAKEGVAGSSPVSRSTASPHSKWVEMQYTITKNETSADVLITYNTDDIEQAYEKAYIKASKKVKINGFRQGKAPLPMVKKVLGETVAEDAIKTLLTDSINSLTPNLDFKPFREPKIEIETFQPKETLVAKAIYELPPTVELGNFKNLDIDIYQFEVQELDIQEQLKKIQFQLSKTQVKEIGESIDSTDLMEIDIDGVTSEGEKIQSAKNHKYYLGVHPENLELESNFLGLKVGEEKNFSFTYPNDYSNKDISGKTIEYHVKVIEISKVILPEQDDSLANEWNESYKTLDDLKSFIKQDIENNTKKSLEGRYLDRLLEKIVGSSTYKFPESILADELNHVYQKTLQDLQLEYLKMEDFAQKYNVDFNEFKSNLEKRALLNLKVFFTINEIAAKEKIQVDQTELLEKYSMYRDQIGPTVPQKNIENLIKNIHDNILVEKVQKFLIENSNKKFITVNSVKEVNELSKLKQE